MPGPLHQAKLAAKPYATHRRQFKLRREPAPETHQGQGCFEVTNSLRCEESGRGGEPGRLAALSGHAWYYYA